MLSEVEEGSSLHRHSWLSWPLCNTLWVLEGLSCSRTNDGWAVRMGGRTWDRSQGRDGFSAWENRVQAEELPPESCAAP